LRQRTHGKVKQMKDDPREVDWPEKKIRGLEAKIDELSAQLKAIERNRTPAPDRVTALEDRVAAIEGDEDDDGIPALENRLNRFDETIDEMGARVAALEGFPRRVKTYPLSFQDEPEGTVIGRDSSFLEKRDANEARGGDPTCSETGHDHTTSSCLGPRVKVPGRGDVVDRLITEGPFVAGGVIPEWITTATAMNTIRAALMETRPVAKAERTRNLALQAAERRVRHYMATQAPWTFEGVAQAIRGAGSGAPLKPEDNTALDEPKRWDRAPVGHQWPEGEAEQRQGPCPGDMACWAANKSKRHIHDSHGVVTLIGS
jgi:hypothetical protein